MYSPPFPKTCAEVNRCAAKTCLYRVYSDNSKTKQNNKYISNTIILRFCKQYECVFWRKIIVYGGRGIGVYNMIIMRMIMHIYTTSYTKAIQYTIPLAPICMQQTKQLPYINMLCMYIIMYIYI